MPFLFLIHCLFLNFSGLMDLFLRHS